MTEFWWLLALAWVACGYIAYRGTFTYFQMQFEILAFQDLTLDRCVSAFVGASGPIGLVVGMAFTDFYKHGFSKQ